MLRILYVCCILRTTFATFLFQKPAGAGAGAAADAGQGQDPGLAIPNQAVFDLIYTDSGIEETIPDLSSLSSLDDEQMSQVESSIRSAREDMEEALANLTPANLLVIPEAPGAPQRAAAMGRVRMTPLRGSSASGSFMLGTSTPVKRSIRRNLLNVSLGSTIYESIHV